ncbi:DUF1998 domain-containing protein (plasmid) [Synechococcus elongatus IITB7]|uniref:DUF1998 domain-containing protein n=1 Tax=Synechococcus elongatus TaxID=32046 RepID=UPI0030D57DA1
MPANRNKAAAPPPLGEARHSQVLQMFGPGAMVDLPEGAVIIGGLNYWFTQGCDTIYEPRLLQLVRASLGLGQVELKTPPKEVDPLRRKGGSMKALRFPEWFVAQKTRPRMWNGKEYRSRPLVHYTDRCQQNFKIFEDDEGKWPLVPVRFVQACPHGHISDINWRAFCFNDFRTTNTEQLYLLEAGTGNDFTQIFVQSASNVTRQLADALIPGTQALGICQGHTPWLGRRLRDEEPCQTQGQRTPNQLLVRSASNAYFAETVSVISLPELATSITKQVAELKADFAEVLEESDVQPAVKFNPRLKAAFNGVDPRTIWEALQQIRGAVTTANKPAEPKDEEFQLFAGPMEGVSNQAEGSIFDAEIWSPASPPTWYARAIRRVLLVHRLREVQALIGFTRFQARYSSLGGLPLPEDGTNRRAALAYPSPTWLPTIENRGEGIFIEFNIEEIKAWEASPVVKARAQQFTKAFEADWLRSRGLTSDQYPFPGNPYILLHSLSHLLITEMALDCGYSASSIRERIYANRDLGYGILLFTGTAGSEGTLGGLVDAGKRVHRYLERAFKRAELCSNDPFCAEHTPNHEYDIRPTHGAACHGCELIAETSCEQRNEFLDRALVSPTVASGRAEDPSFWSWLHRPNA